MTSVSALAVVCFAPAIAATSDPTEAPAVRIKYDENDLNSERGATALYARLRGAAKVVCAQFDHPHELRQRLYFQRCFGQALSNAVLHVNQATVTALHQRAMRPERVAS